MTIKTLMLTPRTHVRSTMGDAILFRIPKDKLRYHGLKRREALERYNDYKDNIRYEAHRQGFTFPDGFFHVTFYIPIPKSTRPKQRAEMHLRPHRKRPDIDNLLKALIDSLLKDDQVLYDVRATKVWINDPIGYIQIEY